MQNKRTTSLWIYQREFCSLKSGLGRLPGGGGRNRAPAPVVRVFLEFFFLLPSSQLHVPLGFRYGQQVPVGNCFSGAAGGWQDIRAL